MRVIRSLSVLLLSLSGCGADDGVSLRDFAPRLLEVTCGDKGVGGCGGPRRLNLHGEERLLSSSVTLDVNGRALRFDSRGRTESNEVQACGVTGKPGCPSVCGTLGAPSCPTEVVTTYESPYALVEAPDDQPFVVTIKDETQTVRADWSALGFDVLRPATRTAAPDEELVLQLKGPIQGLGTEAALLSVHFEERSDPTTWRLSYRGGGEYSGVVNGRPGPGRLYVRLYQLLPDGHEGLAQGATMLLRDVDVGPFELR